MAVLNRRIRPLGIRMHAGAAIGCLLWLAACSPATRATTELISPATERAPYVGRLEDRFFDVLTFNTALLPEMVSGTMPSVRVRRMAPHLAGYDALVLQEAFVDDWRDALVEELTAAYPYRGELVGSDGARGFALRQDGGIVILSRWPIVREATMTFGAVCSGSDCLADKGVAYVAIRKGQRTYHLFGTHAQSVFGWDPPAVRAAQFDLFARFVAAQQIPEDEVVLLSGDLNVNAATPELETMLGMLGAWWPPVVGPVRATWDPANNEWADGPTEWLDYVLVAAGYAVPTAAWNRALPLREGDLDLSDHYAVWARVALPPIIFHFRTRQATPLYQLLDRNMYLPLGHRHRDQRPRRRAAAIRRTPRRSVATGPSFCHSIGERAQVLKQLAKDMTTGPAPRPSPVPADHRRTHP